MVEHWITPDFPGGVRLRWVGVLDLGELYRWMKEWLEDRGFVDETGFTEGTKWTTVDGKGALENENSRHSMEKKYIERKHQGGKNLEITWKVSSEESKYFTFNMFINFLLLAVNDEEAEIRGVKRNLSKGDFELRMGAFVGTPEDDDMTKWSWMQRMHYRFIASKRLELQKRDLHILFYRFHSDLQDYIKNAKY